MPAVDHRPVGCAAAPPRRFGETAPCRQASRTDRALSTAAERPYHFSRRTEWSVDSPSLHVLVASICKWFANARTSRGDKRRRLASSGAVRNPWKICLDRQASCRVNSEQAPSKQRVGGSNPSGRAKPSKRSSAVLVRLSLVFCKCLHPPARHGPRRSCGVLRPGPKTRLKARLSITAPLNARRYALFSYPYLSSQK